jgi:hypothetical protein
VVSLMLISVINIKVICELHKAIKLNYKNIRTTVVFVLRFPSTLRMPSIRYLVTSENSPMLVSDVSLPTTDTCIFRDSGVMLTAI